MSDEEVERHFKPRLWNPNTPKRNQAIEAGSARTAVALSGTTQSTQSFVQAIINIIIGSIEVGLAYWQRDNDCSTDPISIKLFLFINGWVLILIGVANIGIGILECLGCLGGVIEPLASQVGYFYSCPANVIVTIAGLAVTIGLNILGIVLFFQAIDKGGTCNEILVIMVIFIIIWFVGTVITMVINLGCCLFGCVGKYMVGCFFSVVMSQFGKHPDKGGDMI